jgi:hypothetical protein
MPRRTAEEARDPEGQVRRWRHRRAEGDANVACRLGWERQSTAFRVVHSPSAFKPAVFVGGCLSVRSVGVPTSTRYPDSGGLSAPRPKVVTEGVAVCRHPMSLRMSLPTPGSMRCPLRGCSAHIVDVVPLLLVGVAAERVRNWIPLALYRLNRSVNSLVKSAGKSWPGLQDRPVRVGLTGSIAECPGR